MRDNSAGTRASEGGGEGAPDTRAEIPVQTIVQGGADIHLQPMESFLFLQEVKKPKTTQELYKGHNFPVG